MSCREVRNKRVGFYRAGPWAYIRSEDGFRGGDADRALPAAGIADIEHNGSAHTDADLLKALAWQRMAAVPDGEAAVQLSLRVPSIHD